MFWFRLQSLTKPLCGMLCVEDGNSARNRFLEFVTNAPSLQMVFARAYECVSVVCFDADQRGLGLCLSASCGVGLGEVRIQKPLFLSHYSLLMLPSDKDCT